MINVYFKIKGIDNYVYNITAKDEDSFNNQLEKLTEIVKEEFGFDTVIYELSKDNFSNLISN